MTIASVLLLHDKGGTAVLLDRCCHNIKLCIDPPLSSDGPMVYSNCPMAQWSNGCIWSKIFWGGIHDQYGRIENPTPEIIKAMTCRQRQAPWTFVCMICISQGPQLSTLDPKVTSTIKKKSEMKLAITSVLALATSAVAFAPGRSTFTHKATLCSMSAASDFVKSEIDSNDVSSLSIYYDQS